MDIPDVPARPAAARRAKLDWPGRAASWLLSTVVVGVAVNLFSEYKAPALLAVSGLTAVFGIAVWLRRYPGSRLQTWARTGMWTAAAGCSLAALFVPRGAAIGLAGAAAGLLAITVLLAADLCTAGRLLLGALSFGAGGATVVVGVAEAMLDDVLLGSCLAVLGVVVIVGGVKVRESAAVSCVIVALGSGLLAALGVALLRSGGTVLGGGLLVGGVGAAVLGAAMLRNRVMLNRVTTVMANCAPMTLGVTMLCNGDVLFGAMALGAVVALGVLRAVVRHDLVLAVGAMAAGGVALIAVRGTTPDLGDAMYTATLGFSSLGTAMAVTVILRDGSIRHRLSGWWARMTTDRSVPRAGGTEGKSDAALPPIARV